MKRKKIVYLIAWIALGIYLISLFLPFSVETCRYKDGTETKHIQRGIEIIIPISLIGIVPFLALTVLFHLRQTNFSRWTSLFLSILTIFIGIPFILIATTLSFRCSSLPGLGALLHCATFFIFFASAITHFTIPVQQIKRKKTNELLDDL